MTGLGEKYECYVCQRRFTKTRSDEECLAEQRDIWQPAEGDDDVGIVCDDCFMAVVEWAAREAPEILRRLP